MSEVNHWRRVVLWWLLATVITLPLVVFVLGPAMPPGQATQQSAGQVIDNTVLLALSTPVTMAVLVYFTYAMIAFREREPAGTVLDGPHINGNAKVQTWWLIISTTLVLSLAGYGTLRLLSDGAGGGQGPNPISNPAGSKRALQVQVIAQQWKFTYRWPAYGGVETSTLELPTNRPVEFHVTSLDVIHSFWAYQLAVKADANPGFDNVAYVTTRGPLTFNVHCAELCGVFHGYMYDHGRVVAPAAFNSWISQAQAKYAAVTKTLPPYATSYQPEPHRRGG